MEITQEEYSTIYVALAGMIEGYEKFVELHGEAAISDESIEHIKKAMSLKFRLETEYFSG